MQASFLVLGWKLRVDPFNMT